MRHIKKILVLLIALALAAFTIFFILGNQTSSSIKFFTWSSPELPVATFLIIAFIIGLILGALLSWLALTRARLTIKSLRKQIAKAEKQAQLLTEQVIEAESKVEVIPANTVA